MSVYDETNKAVSELRDGGTHARANSYVLAGLRSPLKALTSNHEAVLRKIGLGMFLGPWHMAILYGIRYWPKAEHRALMQLVAGGRLKVVRVSGTDLDEWKTRTLPSESQHVNSDFAYIIVPATVEQALRES